MPFFSIGFSIGMSQNRYLSVRNRTVTQFLFNRFHNTFGSTRLAVCQKFGYVDYRMFLVNRFENTVSAIDWILIVIIWKLKVFIGFYLRNRFNNTGSQ